MLLLAALVPGAMATCSTAAVGSTYGIPPSEAFHYEGNFIIAMFSVWVFPIAIVILLIIIQNYFSDAYRRRIDLRSYRWPAAILGLFCLGWAITFIRQALGSRDSTEALICLVLAALSFANVLLMIYYFNKDVRRRTGK